MRKLIFAVVIITIIAGCSKAAYPSNDYRQPAQTTSTNKDYFSNLTITDVSIKDEVNGWKRVMGKIKNNNSVKVNGYIKIVFYDSDKKIVDTSTISLPLGGLSPNETGVFSEVATKEKFSSIEFFDSTLVSR